jgi:hypothetical protein
MARIMPAMNHAAPGARCRRGYVLTRNLRRRQPRNCHGRIVFLGASAPVSGRQILLEGVAGAWSRRDQTGGTGNAAGGRRGGSRWAGPTIPPAGVRAGSGGNQCGSFAADLLQVQQTVPLISMKSCTSPRLRRRPAAACFSRGAGGLRPPARASNAAGAPRGLGRSWYSRRRVP